MRNKRKEPGFNAVSTEGRQKQKMDEVRIKLKELCGEHIPMPTDDQIAIMLMVLISVIIEERDSGK